jgi:putative transposase
MCELLTRVRSSPPARRVQARGTNVSGTYASRKMGCTIQFESHTVELWAIYTMEHDPAVLEYYDQPTTVRLRYPSSSGRPLTVSHTPDFLVLTHEGAWLEEWKKEEKLQQLTRSQPHRYVRDERGQWRCPPGEEAAAGLGLRYRVRSSVELAPEAIRNLIFLDDYCSGPSIPPALATHVQDLVRATPGISLATLVQTQPQLTLDVVYALIARSHLYVDLAARPLMEHDAVRLYPDRATAEAHALLAASKGRAEDVQGWERPSRPVVLTANTPLLWDGQRWQLLTLGHTTVTLRAAGGHLTELPRPFFQELLEAGKVAVPHVPDAHGLAHLHPEAQRLLREASPYALERANARYAVVQASQQRPNAAETGPPVPARTLRRWVARFKEAETVYGTGYIGLLPRTAQCGNRTRTVDRAALEFLETFLVESFEQPTQPHARAVYRAYHHACTTRGLSALSERTFYRRLHRRRGPEQIARRQGTRAAYQVQPWYWELTRTTPRHGDRPWCALPARLAASPARLAVWPQRDTNGTWNGLLGMLYGPRHKGYTILYLLYRAACRLQKILRWRKGWPWLSQRVAVRSNSNRFWLPFWAPKLFVNASVFGAKLCGNTGAPRPRFLAIPSRPADDVQRRRPAAADRALSMC